MPKKTRSLAWILDQETFERTNIPSTRAVYELYKDMDRQAVRRAALPTNRMAIADVSQQSSVQPPKGVQPWANFGPVPEAPELK